MPERSRIAAAAQTAFVETIIELESIGKKLSDLRSSLELPSDYDDMRSGRIAMTLEARLFEVLGVAESDLRKVIDDLDHAAVETPEMLRTRHQRLGSDPNGQR